MTYLPLCLFGERFGNLPERGIAFDILLQKPAFLQIYRVTGTQESAPVGTPIFDWFAPETRWMSSPWHFGQRPDDFM